MIFGFNTDVKYADTVYHVQSEARQHELLLQTQVFVKGRCIGKHATSYVDETRKPEFSEAHMQDMLREQHKHFVAAVREGRIEAELMPHEHEEHELQVAAVAFAEPSAPTRSAEATAIVEAAAALPPVTAVVVSPPVETEPAPAPEAEAPATTVEIPAAAAPVDELAAEFAAAVASKPVDPGLSLTAIGKLIGKGLALECLPPAPAPDGSSITIGIRISEEGGPAAGAQVSCRITSGKAAARYHYATSGAGGVADLNITLNGLDLSSTALLIQASHRGNSASRKYQLARS